MAKLHNLDWLEIREALKRIGAPTTSKEIDVDKDQLVEALLLAKKIRPERYTILNRLEISPSRYKDILHELGILD
jgi:glycerol-1-phosphate dehydrogenase [NAD(P)+]